MLDKDEMHIVLAKIQKCRTRKFSDLAKIAELDPTVDFRHADLRNSDFSKKDLQSFDFSHSILYGSNFRSSLFNKKSLENANFFENFSMMSLSKVERRTANHMMLAPRYFQRVTAMAALSLSKPDLSISNLLKTAAEHERSRYASDYAMKAVNIIQTEVLDRERRVRLAQEAYRQSYPLARQQYHAALRGFSSEFPIMKSYFDFI